METTRTSRDTTSGLKGMRTMRRKTVGASGADLVRTSYPKPDASLPRMIEPAGSELDLAEWAGSNMEYLEDSLVRDGAILFRGFRINTTTAFERAAQAICPELFAEYGDLPREGISDRVYQSTPYPADKTILFHNESSHLPRWPRKQFFACLIASQEGGETPLLDCRQVYRQLDPAIRQRFEALGLMYVRNFVRGIDVSWEEFFHTSDRHEVEHACQKEGMACEWTEGDNLRIRQLARAVLTHPQTGEKVFFNQIQLHHPYCLGTEVRESMRSIFKEEDLPRNVYYGDGTPIEDTVMESIGQLYWKLAVQLPWQVGDLILLENMLVSHARNPFAGPRKIIVAMGEMIRGIDLN